MQIPSSTPANTARSQDEKSDEKESFQVESERRGCSDESIEVEIARQELRLPREWGSTRLETFVISSS
jgi:hypothetical protein